MPHALFKSPIQNSVLCTLSSDLRLLTSDLRPLNSKPRLARLARPLVSHFFYALGTNECLTDFYERWYYTGLIKNGTEGIKRESRANRERSRRCNPDPTGGGVLFFGIPLDGK